jgi:hypothetical protein
MREKPPPVALLTPDCAALCSFLCQVREFTTGADGKIPDDIRKSITYGRQAKRDAQSRRVDRRGKDRRIPSGDEPQ